MCRTRKCAEGRSALRRCRVASRVGWRRRDEMVGVRLGWVGCEGAWARGRGAVWVVEGEGRRDCVRDCREGGAEVEGVEVEVE
jgi:hypothetical protein